MPRQLPNKKPEAAPQASLLRMFCVCAAVVVSLFLGYEVVERTWLGGADPRLLHMLHLVRGLSAAAFAAVLATLLIVRQRGSRTLSEASLPPLARPWPRRLQHVRVRTKIVVPMVMLAVGPATLLGTFMISSMRDFLRQSAIQDLEFETSSKAQAIRGFLRTVQQDLSFLAQGQTIRNLADAEAEPTAPAAPVEPAARASSQQVAALREDVEREFLIFSQGKRAYYQVRYLDRAGHEVVRLNVEEGRPSVASAEQLQDKSDRYYVTEAFALDPGQIYTSPMDLNVEYGKLEVPVRGVVRYATTVLGTDGLARGLLVINVYADYLLSLIGPLPPQTEAWLVDKGGIYLGYIGRSGERGELYTLRKQRQLSEDFASEEVAAILRYERGALPIETTQAILSYAPISFDRTAPERQWILLIAHPREPLEAPIRQLTIFLSVVLAHIVVLAGVLGILVGHYLARPVSALRRATREIAAGDLSRHVQVTTGDELEGLASDFNTMTDRLREAQQRLSTWNEELEREVVQQTDQLHQLQTALARADKMASIGQMTASVMHEVGNPLAAIKTKIQVAEEDNDLCKGCRAVLSDLLSEVDRLVMFLRSFSRQTRQRQPRMEEIRLDEIIQDVVTLVIPEFRRRGMRLIVEMAPEVPAIQGDAGQLRQLLINLILNAMEASRRQGEISVALHGLTSASVVDRTDDAVVIELVDRGSGIPRDVIDKIWDPFFTSKPEGTGLGLSICREIVAHHGGTIQIQSDTGQGTVVTLSFPRWVPKKSTAAEDGPDGVESEPVERYP